MRRIDQQSMGRFISTKEHESTMQDHSYLMDKIYRWQSRIYDVTRKPYLLGRDMLLAELQVHRPPTILEIGCGTGRNLIIAARQCPEARLVGVDISRVMLSVAHRSIEKAGLHHRINLLQVDASEISSTFDNLCTFDSIFFSYSLSMIPNWRKSVASALDILAEGGVLAIVDFGDQAGWPRYCRYLLNSWLKLFHVSARRSLGSHIEILAKQQGYYVQRKQLYRGYAQLIIVKRPRLAGALQMSHS
jgi:S-adenosylmethionine-diacylgycerolhomoserine-N-methlytransferase